MGIKASFNRFMVDGELILQPSSEAALTATGASLKKLDLQRLFAHWNAAGDIAINQQFTVVLVVNVADVSGDQTYTPSLRVDSAVGMGSAVAFATFPNIVAPGTYFYSVTREQLKKAISDPQFMDINITVAGEDTADFDYWAYAVPFPQSFG
jgi:hypothetical protein